MDSKFENFLFVTIATALLFSTCDSFRTVKLGGKDCTFKGEKVGKKICCYPAKTQLDLMLSRKKTVFDVDVIHPTKDKRHTTGVQRGGGEGDRQVVGEDLHRWQDQVEAQEAGSCCLLVTYFNPAR